MDKMVKINNKIRLKITKLKISGRDKIICQKIKKDHNNRIIPFEQFFSEYRYWDMIDKMSDLGFIYKDRYGLTVPTFVESTWPVVFEFLNKNSINKFLND